MYVVKDSLEINWKHNKIGPTDKRCIKTSGSVFTCAAMLFIGRCHVNRRRKTRNLVVEEFLFLEGEDLVHTLQSDSEKICSLLQGFLLPGQLLQPEREREMGKHIMQHVNIVLVALCSATATYSLLSCTKATIRPANDNLPFPGPGR